MTERRNSARKPAAAQGWSTSDASRPPATFVVLRHGETALSPDKRFSGSGGDPHLSEVGRRQAEAAAAALACRGDIQAIVSSPMRRCRETAAAAAGRLGADVQVEDDLREADFGAWEGLTFQEVQERFPTDLPAWQNSSSVSPTGSSENFDNVTRRVEAARDRLISRYAGRTVLVVTHVTPVKTLVRLALCAPPESIFRMELTPAGISVITYYSDGGVALRALNCTAHLDVHSTVPAQQ
jgi:ribonuclease H / adenosylcobalamin/alpha-ribazole phosphatase